MPTENKQGAKWRYVTDPIAVANPVTVNLPPYIKDFSITVETDVAGTGSIDITGSVGGSPNVNIGVNSIDIAAIDVKNNDKCLDSITFTPNTIVTATTYTIYLSASKDR